MLKKHIDKLIIKKHQRYSVNNKFTDKIIVKLTKNYYKDLFVTYKDRKELSSSLWGGEGGYQHAKNQFEREDWQNDYKAFYEFAQDNIEAKSKILEIGCSMGQWVKRLALDVNESDYTGIDINPKSIIEAKKIFDEHRNIKFECVDLNDGYDLSNFDFILCVQVLFFLDIELIKKIFSTVNIGTKLIISEPINSKQQALSEKLIHEHSVGFSHDYVKVFNDLGFVHMHSDLFKTKRSRNRISIVFRKDS